MSPAEAAQLRRRFLSSKSQTFWRPGALAYTALSQNTFEGGCSKHMTGDLLKNLTWWIKFMKTVEPRKVPVGKQTRPIFIFTDGSCEPDTGNRLGLTAGYGALLLDPGNQILQSFGGTLAGPGFAVRRGCQDTGSRTGRAGPLRCSKHSLEQSDRRTIGNVVSR